MIEISGPIPIRIHPLFWLLAFGIGWLSSDVSGDQLNQKITLTVLWAAIIFCSVLFHELGHALTGMAFGQTVSIELLPLGGLTKRIGQPLNLWKEFLIVLAGPTFGIVLAVLAYKGEGWLSPTAPDLLKYALGMTAAINFFWTFINLLPVNPLDGGRLLHIILEGLFGFRGVKIALFLSLVFSCLFALFFFVKQELFIGAIFFMLAAENFRAWRQLAPVSKGDQNEDCQRLLTQAESEIKSGSLAEGLETLNRLCELSPQGILFEEASDLRGFVLHRLGKNEEAFQDLLRRESRLSFDSLQLLQKIAYQRGEFKVALRVGTKAYQVNPKPEIALTNALVATRLQDSKAAVGWLHCVSEGGLPHFSAILQMPEFDAIRQTPSFQSLQSTLK